MSPLSSSSPRRSAALHGSFFTAACLSPRQRPSFTFIFTSTTSCFWMLRWKRASRLIKVSVCISEGVDVWWSDGGHPVLQGRTHLQEVRPVQGPRWNQPGEGNCSRCVPDREPLTGLTTCCYYDGLMSAAHTVHNHVGTSSSKTHPSSLSRYWTRHKFCLCHKEKCQVVLISFCSTQPLNDLWEKSKHFLKYIHHWLFHRHVFSARYVSTQCAG